MNVCICVCVGGGGLCVSQFEYTYEGRVRSKAFHQSAHHKISTKYNQENEIPFMLLGCWTDIMYHLLKKQSYKF